MSWWKCRDCEHVFTEPGIIKSHAVVGYGSTMACMECGDPCCPECGSEDYKPTARPDDD